MEKFTKNSRLLGSLGTYEFLETDDGTMTLHSAYFDEACHSTSGALKETIHNYVLGTKVPQRLERGPLCVFEVGFATGLGLKATLLNASYDHHKNLTFVSSELDGLLCQHFLEALKSDEIIESFHTTDFGFQGRSIHGATIYILIGDVRETLPLWRKNSLFLKFKAIYQDPFSPKKNPSLWTKEWFSELKAASESEVILGTYSSTKAVWKSMIAAGWKVTEVPGYGKKRLSTRAMLEGESSKNVIEWCKRSPAPALCDKET
jgi:tRNA U34 5-methylaminomethyl-2-thiouridine-forming methyltransferase MnmC